MDFLDKYFGLSKSGSNLYNEIVAGITTFFAMSYILFVNPTILADIGMPAGAAFTATALATIFGCLVMGIYAKLPFALAPGMGLNTFFAYTICLKLGHTWQFALTTVFIEGIFFFLISVLNIRQFIINLIPRNLQLAFCPGIGLFIAFIGLQKAGLIVDDPKTLLAFGDITNSETLLACVGILMLGVFYVKKIYSGMLFVVLLLTAIDLPFGMTKIDSLFSLPPSVSSTVLKFDFSEILSYDFICITILLLSIDIFDTMGTLVGVSNINGMQDKQGSIKNARQAFIADSLATVFGSAVGTSTTTTYVESAAGISVGGRTGITSVVTAFCFAISLLAYPLLSIVPPAAVAVMLIFAGGNMFIMGNPFNKMDLTDYSESIPVFITIIMIPFSFSIIEGISFGVMSYVLINAFTGNIKKTGVGTCILAVFFIARYVAFKL